MFRIAFVLALLCAGVVGMNATALGAKKPKATDVKPDTATAAPDDKSVEPSSTSGGIDAARLESDKDLAKFVKSLRKRFKKDGGYYVVRLVETGVRQDGAQNQAVNDAKVSFQPYSHVTIEMLDGREAAVARIVAYLEEQTAPPWQKKATSRNSKRSDGDAPMAAPSKRDWQPVGWFPQTEEGLQLASETRDRTQQRHDAEAKAREELMNPPCPCKKAQAEQ